MGSVVEGERLSEFRSIIASSILAERKVRRSLYSAIMALPDNPRIRRMPGSPQCFVMQYKDLGPAWSAEYHDFQAQYRFLVRVLKGHKEARTVLRTLRSAVEQGYVIDTTKGRERMSFHPDVREHLRALLGKRKKVEAQGQKEVLCLK